MAEGPSYRDIALLAKQSPEAFATAVIGEGPTQRLGGQVRYFESGWLAVFTSGRRQGTFYSFQNEEDRGDMLDLYKWHTGKSAHEAIIFAKRFLGIEEGEAIAAPSIHVKSPEEIAREEADEAAKRIRTAQWIWNQASETDGREEGLSYLRGRGITTEIPRDIMRFRRLSRQDLLKMGVSADDIPETPVVSLILKATDEENTITAVQQILTTNGRKVGFENPKRTNGLMQGAAVRLGDARADRSVSLIEGPETGLSVWQSTGKATYITLGTSNFVKVSIPAEVTTVVTGADMEPSGIGLASALKSAQFWQEQGRRSGIALPRMNEGDFNDMHQAQGDAAVKSSFEKAFFAERTGAPGVVFATTDSRSAFYAWTRTGTETISRVPPLDRSTGIRKPLNLHAHIRDHHRHIIVLDSVESPVNLQNAVPENSRVSIDHLDMTPTTFRKMAREVGAVEALFSQGDVHAPSGPGESESVVFSLRRKDTDALEAVGEKSIAIRSGAIDTMDFSFMAGREAFLAPVGSGTDADRSLAEKLEKAGAHVSVLQWQVFRPAENGSYEIIHNSIPSTYGASDAIEDGWSGKSLNILKEVSRFYGARKAALAVVEANKKEAPEKPAEKSISTGIER